MKIKAKIIVLPAVAFSSLIACDRAAEQPNIILILADDMGYSDLGCYGSEISTPNLDLLAEKGIRFTQFYNTARSCPSRASLLTGLNPHQTGLGAMTGAPTGAPGYQGEISANCVTIAEVLKESGYGTYMTGKWHLTPSLDGSDKDNWPVQRGFDRFFGTINGGGNYYNPFGLLLDNDFFDAEDDFYYTDHIGSKMIGFIKHHLSNHQGNPFFSYIAFTAPHWPLHAPDSLIAKYHGRYSLGWDSLRVERFERQKVLGIIPADLHLSERDKAAPSWELAGDKKWQERRMEVYAAQIEAMDRNIGHLIKLLEAEKVLDNTLIIFLSDNGACAEELGAGWLNFLTRLAGRTTTREGDSIIFCNVPAIMPGPETTFQSVGLPWANAQNTPLRLFKIRAHEGGISTPMIISWPERISENGKIIGEPGMLMDIMATCIDAAGASYPTEFKGNEIIPHEGYSLIPVITEGKPNPREIMFWEHLNNRALRKGEWKLVSQAPNDEWELYNLENDRTESVNLAEKYPEIVKDLSNLWHDWATKTNALPKPGK